MFPAGGDNRGDRRGSQGGQRCSRQSIEKTAFFLGRFFFVGGRGWSGGGYLHAEGEDRVGALLGAYKLAAFCVQLRHYLRTGGWIREQRELMRNHEGMERDILEAALEGKKGVAKLVRDPEGHFRRLLEWSREQLRTT